MRKSFEINVRNFNDSARAFELAAEKAADTNALKMETARLETVVMWQIENAAYHRASTKETQKRISDLQSVKRAVLKELKKNIAILDEKDREPNWPANARKVTMKNGSLVATAEDGAEYPITVGELMTDGSWGEEADYAPDKSVQRNLRKRLLIESAKRSIAGLLDAQIMEDEIGSSKTSANLRKAYVSRYENYIYQETPQAGLIAEKMVNNFLKKIGFASGAAFEIIEADIHQDVTKKIDFIIRRKANYRGVGVETGNLPEVEVKGIQFMSNDDPERIAHKSDQLKRANAFLRPEDTITEIILVTVPLLDTKQVYGEWDKERKPGGPDKLWSQERKKEIFFKVLAGMFSEQELEEQWATIAQQV